MRQRGFLLTILAILLVVLGVLVYLYITLVRPFRPVPPVRTTGMTFLAAIYGYGSAPEEQLAHPHGVAVDKKGNVYITDKNRHRVLVFNRRERFLRKIGDEGEGPGKIRYPLGIAVAPNGNIYVADKLQSKVVVYNSKGDFVKEIKETNPLALTIANKNLYVVTPSQVVIFDLKGNLLKRFGKETTGAAKGELDFPGGIAVDDEGNIYVSDSNNKRLQALTKEGRVIWVATGEDIGLPEGATLDEKERLFMMDAFDASVQVFNSKGKRITRLGGSVGSAEGQFYFPSGIAYAGKGIFYIADEFNNRIQKVRIRIASR